MIENEDDGRKKMEEKSISLCAFEHTKTVPMFETQIKME